MAKSKKGWLVTAGIPATNLEGLFYALLTRFAKDFSIPLFFSDNM